MKSNKVFLLIILGIIFLTSLALADAIAEITVKVIEIGCGILRILFYLSSAIAALFIMLAGVKYITSDSPEDRCEARNNIIYAIIGLAIILIACPLVDYFIQETEVTPLRDLDCCPFYSMVSTPTVKDCTDEGGFCSYDLDCQDECAALGKSALGCYPGYDECGAGACCCKCQEAAISTSSTTTSTTTTTLENWNQYDNCQDCLAAGYEWCNAAIFIGKGCRNPCSFLNCNANHCYRDTCP